MFRLREIRKTNNKTQSEVAKYLGLSQQSYARYEAQDLIPSGEILLKLADYFGVTVDYLLGREEKAEQPQLTIPEEYKDIQIAFSGGIKDLTQDDINNVVSYIEFLKNKKK